MEKYYLTSNLFIEKGKIYYQTNESKKIKINERNLFKYMSEYGWEKLPLQYRRKLDDNKFLLLECGADGNCLFHVIAEALNTQMISNNTGDLDEAKLYDV